MSDEKIFSEEYQVKNSTGAEKPKAVQSDISKELDMSKYPVNKPKRVIIKAKLIDDKN